MIPSRLRPPHAAGFSPRCWPVASALGRGLQNRRKSRRQKSGLVGMAVNSARCLFVQSVVRHFFMKTIGFRAEPFTVNWAVVEGSKGTPVLIGADEEKAPATFDEPARLKWFRERIQHLLQTYSPAVAAVRYPETFQRSIKVVPLGQRC